MKTTITAEDLTLALRSMQEKNTTIDVMKAIDPDITETQIYFYHERLKFWRRTSRNLTIGEAAALMIEEEGITDITIILGIFGYVNFYYGGQAERHADRQANDKIRTVLDKLAEELGGKVEVVKVNMGEFMNNTDDKS